MQKFAEYFFLVLKYAKQFYKKYSKREIIFEIIE